MTILIEKTTEAAVSETISFVLDSPATERAINEGYFPKESTVCVTGGSLGAEEYVKLEYNDGESWVTLNVSGDEGKILDTDNSARTIYGRLVNVRLSKSETSSARGVMVV